MMSPGRRPVRGEAESASELRETLATRAEGRDRSASVVDQALGQAFKRRERYMRILVGRTVEVSRRNQFAEVVVP